VADFDWDPERESRNVKKHGLDFTTASEIWVGPVVEKVDDRQDYGRGASLPRGLPGRMFSLSSILGGERIAG
jgi:uncharacterized DUF497 family protein